LITRPVLRIFKGTLQYEIKWLIVVNLFGITLQWPGVETPPVDFNPVHNNMAAT